ncbi:MAG: QcrA and Rieske domain-containing protein [Acidimicrobiales bacterium]
MTHSPTAQSPDEPLPVAALDDPHLQPYAKHPERAELVVGFCLLVGLLGFAGFGAVYWVNWSTQWQALFFGVGLFGFGFGLSAWGKYLLPHGPFSEERHPFASTEPEIRAFAAAVNDRGKLVFRRRGMLGGLLGLGAAVMGVVLGFPLVRSLGPLPGKALDVTNWKRGSRLVDLTGRPLHQSDLPTGGSITVFPEGFVGSAVDQTMLVRPGDPGIPIVTKKGRETWGPSGYLAYSKLCTHAGCPVGLYMEETQQMLCPCHQSLFDVMDGGQQVFGPAPRPLPQLPLMIDAEGWIRAQGPYQEPVGPGFWERS